MRSRSSSIALVLVVACAAATSLAQPTHPTTSPSVIAPRTAAWKSDEWIKSEEGRRVVQNVLAWQNADGGWPKNYDALRAPATARSRDRERGSTFDNGATYSELRLLARAYTLDGNTPEHKAAFDRGLKYLLDAQYENGGWPQRFPLEPNNYSRHITFNDGATVGVMRILESIRNNSSEFALVSDDDRARVTKAFDRGIECILNCQIKADGKLTAWCQQHDEVTLAPAPARTFEPPCIASNESAGLAMLLMSQPNPSPRVRESIEAAMKWFDEVKVTGKRYEEVTGPQYERGRDRILVDDPNAKEPVWARMYEIGTNRPVFSGRDSAIKYSLAEVEYERRTGYGWYGRWPSRAVAMYEEWKKGAGK